MYIGCKLGEASDFIVRQGTLIQVPSSAGDVGCYKICTCGHTGLLENCVEMHCVDLQKSCIVGGQKKSKYQNGNYIFTEHVFLK